MPSRRPAAALFTALALLGFSASAQARQTNPLVGVPLFADPASQAARAAESASRGDDRSAASGLRRIAAQPQAFWLTGAERLEELGGHLAEARSARAQAVVVIYAIPGRDCGLHSAGGSSGALRYRALIDQVVREARGHRVSFILEPDAIAGADCLSAGERRERNRLLSQAIARLSVRGPVYLDAGHPAWHSAGEISRRIAAVGLRRARGISLNVSNFQTTASNRAYGRQIARLLGRPLPLVIDTSRNGSGPAQGNAWCNPAGVRLGSEPQVLRGDGQVDALLWIKRPGESDGRCGGGPEAGQFWPAQAVLLAR